MKKKYLVLQINNKNKKKDWINKLLTNKKKQINNKVYTYLTDYIFYEDIYVYNQEEYFIDITNYQDLYQKTPYQLALELKNKLSKKLNLQIKIGLGTNLFLAKTACDIITEKKKTKIAYLDEKEYLNICSTHQPLSDFWQISKSMMLKLNKLGINTMKDIRNYSYQLLYQEFGYNAEYLINHSLGLEATTIQSLNNQKTPKTISSCTKFTSVKTKKESIKELINLLDFNILKLKENSLTTKKLHLYIKYANNIIPREIIHITLNDATNSYKKLMQITTNTFKEKANLFIPIEKIAISFGEITKIIDNNYQIYEPRKKEKFIPLNIFYKTKKETLTNNKKMTYIHT